MNKKKILSIVLISLGAIISTVAIVFLFLNMSLSGSYDNGAGHFENDYDEAFLGAGMLFTSSLLLGLSILGIGLYILLSKKLEKFNLYGLTGLTSAIMAFMGIAYIFLFNTKVISRVNKIIKALSKSDYDSALSKANEILGYQSTVLYGLLAIVGSIALGFSIKGMLDNRKNNK